MIVADAGFTGFDLMREILAHGHSFLIRVGANVTLLKALGVAVKQDGDTVWLWPTGKRGQSPLKLRLIRLSRRIAGSSAEMWQEHTRWPNPNRIRWTGLSERDRLRKDEAPMGRL